MKLICQLNFSTGLGDFFVALSELLTSVSLFKSDYPELITELRIFTHRNKYCSDFNCLLQHIDSSTFNVFNKYSVNENIIFNRKHEDFEWFYTQSGANPGMHWWDLFLDDEARSVFNKSKYLLLISQYHNNFNISIDTLTKNDIVKIKFSDVLLNKINSIIFDYPNYESIYFRNKDIANHTHLYDNSDAIKKILNNKNEHYYITSNNNNYKHLLTNNYKNTFIYDQIPEFANLHFPIINYSKDDNVLSVIIEQSLIDMLILSFSKKIYFFTEWPRVSNFLFFAWLENINMSVHLL